MSLTIEETREFLRTSLNEMSDDDIVSFHDSAATLARIYIEQALALRLNEDSYYPHELPTIL